MKRAWLSIVLVLTAAIPVFADQAAWVSRAEAARALEILAKHDKIRHFCAPCGDSEVTEEAVESIGMFLAKDGTSY